MQIRTQRIDTIIVPVEGVSPLIVSRFDEKAKEQMLAAQQSKTRKAKEPKDPDKEFERRRYRLADGRDGFPAVGFKAAIVGGARLFEGVTMTALKTQLYVHGDGIDLLVPIDGLCTMREDTVRVGNGVADLRYRPMYWPWHAELHIDFMPSQLSHESVHRTRRGRRVRRRSASGGRRHRSHSPARTAGSP